MVISSPSSQSFLSLASYCFRVLGSEKIDSLFLSIYIFYIFSRLSNGVVGNSFIRNAESSRFPKSYSADAAIGGSLVEESEEKDDLRSRIFRLRLPKRSATTVLEKWVGEGNQITVNELREISRELRKTRRYKHALEVFPPDGFWNSWLPVSRLEISVNLH